LLAIRAQGGTLGVQVFQMGLGVKNKTRHVEMSGREVGGETASKPAFSDG